MSESSETYTLQTVPVPSNLKFLPFSLRQHVDGNGAQNRKTIWEF